MIVYDNKQPFLIKIQNRSAKFVGVWIVQKHEKHRGGLPCGRGREAPEEHNQQYKKKQKGDRSLPKIN